MKDSFKDELPFNDRVELCNRLRTQNNEGFPIIIKSIDKGLKITRRKFLVPGDCNIGDLLHQLRPFCDIDGQQAIFLFCGNGVLVPTSYTITQAYQRYADKDGFLYISVALENSFGVYKTINNTLDSILNISRRISRTLGLI